MKTFSSCLLTFKSHLKLLRRTAYLSHFYLMFFEQFYCTNFNLDLVQEKQITYIFLFMEFHEVIYANRLINLTTTHSGHQIYLLSTLRCLLSFPDALAYEGLSFTFEKKCRNLPS